MFCCAIFLHTVCICSLFCLGFHENYNNFEACKAIDKTSDDCDRKIFIFHGKWIGIWTAAGSHISENNEVRFVWLCSSKYNIHCSINFLVRRSSTWALSTCLVRFFSIYCPFSSTHLDSNGFCQRNWKYFLLIPNRIRASTLTIYSVYTMWTMCASLVQVIEQNMPSINRTRIPI